MLSPMGHENANEDPQADDHEEEEKEMINPTPTPENKPRKKNITKIVFDRSPMKTPEEPQPNPRTNIKSRLGCTKRTSFWSPWVRTSCWSPWIQGREPNCVVEWNKEYKQFLTDQIREIDAQEEKEVSSSNQTDENKTKEQIVLK